MHTNIDRRWNTDGFAKISTCESTVMILSSAGSSEKKKNMNNARWKLHVRTQRRGRIPLFAFLQNIILHSFPRSSRRSAKRYRRNVIEGKYSQRGKNCFARIDSESLRRYSKKSLRIESVAEKSLDFRRGSEKRRIWRIVDRNYPRGSRDYTLHEFTNLSQDRGKLERGSKDAGTRRRSKRSRDSDDKWTSVKRSSLTLGEGEGGKRVEGDIVKNARNKLGRRTTRERVKADLMGESGWLKYEPCSPFSGFFRVT